MTAHDEQQPLLTLRGISKSFFGNEVLSDIDLDCYRGEVHAIVGENGAGKSTLMKIIAGAYQPDRGTMTLDGEEVTYHLPADAQAKGVSIIYQEFNLLTDRTVAQNIFLGREPRKRFGIDRQKMERDTAELLAMLHVDSISPRQLVGSLSVAQQQMVEIAKALSFDARLLIMDEPTASLSPPEAEALFERVNLLRERGLSILYISHRLKEVFDLSQRITVIKDGRKVDTVLVDDVSPTDLVTMMVGRELSHYYPERARPEELGDVRLRVRGGGNARLRGIDFTIRAGEVVGMAGLEGSGRTEVAQALFGVEPFTEGVVELDGEPVRIRSPRQAIKRGLGYISEDRKSEGLVLVRSITENGGLALETLPSSERRARGVRDKTAAVVADLVDRVDVRAASLDQEVQFLSGGNQQKVVLVKWLATRAKVLIFDEPTRGIDVGAKAGIHDLIRELAREGLAVLMISSELPEVIGMSDRILVMRNGELAGELPAGSSEAEIMLLATGQEERGAAIDEAAAFGVAQQRSADEEARRQEPAASTQEDRA